MSAAHTPGPWFTSSRSDGGIGPKSNDENQSFDIVIPVAYIEAFDWPGSFAHNARLIAAAPDLLEALILQEEIYQMGILNGAHLLAEATRKRKAAITKATGATT